MKLYNHAHAPNPRRVRIFAAEKGIELPLEEVDILAGQSRTSEFLAKNSSGAVPVLELDDGSHLSESVAICRYLEGLHPEPNLLGRDLREQAEIERWNRRMELELFAPIGRTFQNTNPIFQRRIKQFPEYGEAQRAIVYQRLERMDHELDGQEFIASDRFTIADITALVAIDFGGRLADLQIAPSLTSFDPLAGDGLKVCKRQSMTPSPCATMNGTSLARRGQGPPSAQTVGSGLWLVH